MMNKEELQEAICSEFGKLQYPGDSSLVHNSDDWESAELLKDFLGKKWKDLTIDLIVPKHGNDLFLLTNEAYRYYLPGFMLLMLNSFYESDILADAVISSLNPFFSELDRFLKRISEFSTPQKKVIKEFLEYIKDTHSGDSPFFKKDVEQALEYWKKQVL
jgi:hypothetical protein